jgi:hypothetical protein
MSGMIRSLRPYGEFPALGNGGSTSERKEQRNKGKGKAVERDEGEGGGQGAFIFFSQRVGGNEWTDIACKSDRGSTRSDSSSSRCAFLSNLLCFRL